MNPFLDMGAEFYSLSTLLTAWLARAASGMRERELREINELFDQLATQDNL